MDKKSYFEFEAIELKERVTLLHVQIKDDYAFYRALFDFFFDENRIHSYIENKTGLVFSPTIKHYAALYRQLKCFIDEKNIVCLPNTISVELRKILDEEYDLEEGENGTLKIRSDKMGKIGEYKCD